MKIDKLSEHKCLDYLLHTENHGYCLMGKLSSSENVVILKCHDFTILKKSADGIESLIQYFKVKHAKF